MPDDASITFQCPHCSQSLEGDAQILGTEIACPQCQNLIQVPAAVVEAPALVEAPPQEKQKPPAVAPFLTPQERKHLLTVTTGNEISGRTIKQYLGIASGIIVRSPSGTESLFGGLKQIVGGNIEAYAKLCRQARLDAYDRMIEDAARMNADAVIAFRFDATEFAPGVTEVLAYGTAVKLETPS